MIDTRHGEVISLKNHTCPYCEVRLKVRERQRDHVIGTHFVPTGALEGTWNLILNVCRACHKEKSDLEDDISATTILPDLGRPHADSALAKEAERKGHGSVSRRTGKPIALSVERGKFSGSLGPGMTFSFETVAPPQLEDDRVHRLARFHALAFFYWRTYDEKKHEGGVPPGVFFPVNVARRPDWGNPLQRAFAETIRSWPIRVGLETARGYFRAIVRRNMPEDCWCFGFEWNRALRCIGFFGDQSSIEAVYEKLPKLEMHEMARDERTFTRMRVERLLAEDEDRLFDF